jgi:ADP-heptose:LPS heptosyltransferase
MKRILVVKLSSLGDIAHALPAVRALKERTGAEIDWLVQPEYAGLLECCPDVARAIPFPRRHPVAGAWRFWKALRREEYGAVIDLQGLLKSALPARLARRTRRAKVFGPAWAREGAEHLYTLRPVKNAGARRHAVLEAMDVVGLYAPPEEGAEAVPRPRIEPPEWDGEEPEGGDGEETAGPRVGMAPFSRWSTKNWGTEKFAELGARLAREMGCRIHILGGPGDAAEGRALAGRIPGARAECGTMGLASLCGFMKGLDLMVSVDSGPMHWADAMGVPLVAVYGATDPVRTGPWWQPESVVTAEGLECRPCHARKCRRGDCACLGELSVEAVFRAAMAQL